ncbi:MAG TPA: STAS domain-containing protein [Cerasibacillus sp.]|uniref:STAS domain-containing protein n=1 Tax=Cerasibacillus sp. TaxID=2498711 RepID=UPI002F3EAD4A
MNLTIDVLEKEQQSIVCLSGEIDVYTANDLKERLIPLTEKEGTVVEVDFNHVRYMDSTGLGVFIGALKSTKKHGSHLKLIHLNHRVLRLFKITGLNEIMDIAEKTR